MQQRSSPGATLPQDAYEQEATFIVVLDDEYVGPFTIHRRVAGRSPAWMVTTAGALRVALPRRDGGEGAQAKLTPAAHTDFYGSRRRTSKEASGAGAGARYPQRLAAEGWPGWGIISRESG